jgi:hypothetical protein
MKMHRLAQDPVVKKSAAVLTEAKAVLATYHEALGRTDATKPRLAREATYFTPMYFSADNDGPSECIHCHAIFAAHTDGVCPAGKDVVL